MIFELLATLSAGLCAAGILYITFKTVGRKPPKFLVPLTAGLAMIFLNGYIEYSWSSRVQANLPPDSVILQEFRDTSALRPWSYINAPVNRFMALDPSKVRRNPANQNMVMAAPRLQQRYFEPVNVTVIVNCANGTQADLTPDVEFDAQGLPLNAQWYDTGRGDALFEAVCRA